LIAGRGQTIQVDLGAWTRGSTHTRGTDVLISAVGVRGGNREGNRAQREVFPLCCIQSNVHRAMKKRLNAPAFCSNYNQRRD
jgi:hypothetical protein